MDNDRVYFLVNGGPALDAVRKWQADNKAALDAWKAWQHSIGASALYAGRQPTGAVFLNGEKPAGWRVNSNKKLPREVLVPNQMTPEGKALAKSMKELPPRLGAFEFSRMLGEGFDVLRSGGRWLASLFEEIGDKVIVAIPAKDGGTVNEPPGDCVRLKMSEYWAIREAHEEESRQMEDGE